MMKKPKKAILDGDIIVWKAAFVTDAEGSLAIDSLLRSLISKWTPKGIKKVDIALSCKPHENFRKEVFPAYKSNRAAAYKPDCLSEVFETMKELYHCMILPSLEADDILGIYSSLGEAIAVSIDKDLRGVRGWSYNPDKDKKPIFITKEDAERWFCTQWMAGDSTDGIPGLWRIGKKKASKYLEEWDIKDWYNNIKELYDEEIYAPREEYDIDDVCLAMGRCVRILQKENYDLDNKKIKLWNPKDGL